MDTWVIGIGGMKCASTWAYQCLREHPEICMSSIKEINFFNKHYDRGEAWYLDHFKGCPTDSIKGEFSATYLYDPDAARRIASFRPEIKIIACVRNPIDRAVSDYNHLIRGGGIDRSLCFEDALKNSKRLLANGLYGKNLEPFFQYWSEQDIIIIVAEEVARDSNGVLQNLYHRLGIADDFVPSSARKTVHKGIIPRMAWAERMRMKVYRQLVSQERGDIIDLLKNTGIPKVYRKINTRPGRRAHMSPNTRRELADYFRDDVEQFKQLTSLSLPLWEEFQ